VTGGNHCAAGGDVLHPSLFTTSGVQAPAGGAVAERLAHSVAVGARLPATGSGGFHEPTLDERLDLTRSYAAERGPVGSTSGSAAGPQRVLGTVCTSGKTPLLVALRLPVLFGYLTERRGGSHDAHTLRLPIEITS
jgi:hypothetical protein